MGPQSGQDSGPLSQGHHPGNFSGMRETGLQPNTQNLRGHQLLTSPPPPKASLPTSPEGVLWAISPRAACRGSLDILIRPS